MVAKLRATLHERTMLSVIIPTLNAADSLRATMGSLPPGFAHEVVVSDGGSSDGTVALAEGLGARVVQGPAGRGGQLARGAVAATGDWLLFLHGDSRLTAAAVRDLARHMARVDGAERAAVPAYALDAEGAAARRLEKVVRWRCRLLALPYGDQGLLMSRALYDRVGGFRDLPLMEDVDMVRRIGRRRLSFLAGPVVTSARRYLQDGYLRRMLRNGACLTLYFLGLPPARIARIYER